MGHSSSVFKTLLYFTCLAGLMFSACSHSAELTRVESNHETAPVEYSVIYYIHADADYLFHDSDGRPIYANTRVLETALEVANQAHSGEVFIFYQRPERKFLGLFPRKKSQFYHFVNGELITRVKYRHPDKSEAFLTTEAQLYNQYRIPSRGENQQRYLLYFGHEIPTDEGSHYHRTLPDIQVTTSSFAEGIHQFLSTDDQRFNLVVLSTCNNGTPGMAHHLMPFTDFLLASPQNLHLSHIDSNSLNLLETNSQITPLQVADSMAGQTYQRLVTDIQTTITLATYDLEVAGAYINELYTLTTAQEASGPANPFQDHVDCSRFTFFDAEKYNRGVETWYHPARFGRQKTATSHSGWGCTP